MNQMMRLQLEQRKRREAGSTMVLALMVTLLLMIIVVAAVTLSMADSEMVQDYARNKKSFQAADSGVAHSEVRLAHALSSWSIPPSTSPEEVDAYATDAESGVTDGNRDISLLETTALHLNDVLPDGEARGVETTFGSTEYESGGVYVSYSAGINITPTGVTYPAADDISHQHTFHYMYTIDSRGEAAQNAQHHKATREQRGSFDVEVKRPSFATYGYFTNSMKNQFDDQLVFFDGEVYDGPTHVNSAPPNGRAGFYGSPVFNGPFTAVQDRYEDSWLGGNANPQFNDSATWGVDEIPTPENGWSQLRAAVGDYSHVEDPSLPSNTELRSLLGLPAGAGAVDPGVYFSSNYNHGNQLLGGLFINGDVDSIQLDASGSNQIISVTLTPTTGQFSNGNARTWVFTTNPNGNTSVTLDGVAAGSFTGPLNGMIHVEGNINGLGGDGNVASADVESDMGLTVSATGAIYINDHITYETDPRTNADAKNILGIFSSGSNIYLAQEAPSNLQLHATVMAVGADCGVGAEGLISGAHAYNYNYPDKGNWNLLGGLIEDKNQTTGVYYNNGHRTGYRWNFDYDERFNHGVAPPFFPYVTRFIIEMKNKEAQSWGRKYY
jgi:Tfp pilus assembly protein PilX